MSLKDNYLKQLEELKTTMTSFTSTLVMMHEAIQMIEDKKVKGLAREEFAKSLADLLVIISMPNYRVIETISEVVSNRVVEKLNFKTMGNGETLQ